VQSAEAEVVRKLLADLVAQLNTVITTSLPNLYKQLTDSSIHPGMLAPIPTVPPAGPQ